MPETSRGYDALLRIERSIGEIKAGQAMTTAKVEHMEEMGEQLSAAMVKLSEKVIESQEARVEYQRRVEEFWGPRGQAARWDADIQQNRAAVANLREHIDSRFDETLRHIDDKVGGLEKRVAALEGRRRETAAATKAKAATIAKGSAVVGGAGAVIAWLAEHWDKFVTWWSK